MVGLADDGYRYGLVMMNFDFIGCAFPVLAAAFLFMPFLWIAGVYTVPEYLGRRFNPTVRMTPPFSREELTGACTGVVAKNGFHEDVQVRPTVYFGEGGLYAFTPDKIATGAFITSTPRRCTLDDEKGIACCVSAWRRIGDNVMPPRVKAGASYHQSRLVNVQATV